MHHHDTEFMQRALRLAANGLYTTEPNPRVGCVLVQDGAIVGEGWHRQAGGPHAEIEALRAAGERARGATAYVSLEPCCHSGKTGPCSEALIGAGVARVVAAMQDPNPLVAGKGMARLADSGISTEVGLLQGSARELNPGFIMRMQQGRPFVRLKLAASLDGKTAMASGESQWITGEAARKDVQRLRARSGAVLTGIGTVLADDPRLDVRIDGAGLGVEHGLAVNRPLRVVLDSEARLQATAALLQAEGEVLQVTADDTATTGSAACERVSVPRDTNQLDLFAVMDLLAAREINECHVECGATLAGSLLMAGLVDELVLYLAPHIMGDAARGLFAIPGLERMQDRIELDVQDVRMLGRDLRITAAVLGACEE